ncbi:MAG: gliding motility-associated C-terminal domain-containing protein [Bacteroidota bacterium]
MASTTISNHTVPAGFGIPVQTYQVCSTTPVALDAGSDPNIVSYNWNTGATTQTITANDSGWYYVTITDLNGCSWADTARVVHDTLPFVQLGPDTTLCQPNTLTLTAPTGYNYNWSVGGATNTVTISNSALVFVTVLDPNSGCSSVDSIDVVVSPAPVPTPLNTTQICDGDSLLLDPGSGFASYSWSTGANSQTIYVDQPGSYDVTVTNAAGCTAVESMTLSLFAPVTVNVNGANTGCDGTPVALQADPGFSTYDWSNGDNGQTINVLASGTYTVTATDANGCVATDAIAVTFNSLPVVSLGGTDTLCDGATIGLDAGGGFVNYAWSTGSSAQAIPVTATGTYSVTVTDINGCMNSASVDVISSTIAPVDLGAATQMICDSGGILLDAGPQYIAYQWNPPLSSNQYLFVEDPGVYEVTVTDQFGCPSTDDVTIVADGIMNLDFMTDDTVMCAGEEFILDAGDEWIFYEWDNGPADQYLVVTTAGTYTVTVTDDNGCRFTDQIEVTMDVPPGLEIGPNVNVCPDETVTLDAGPGFTSYMWSTGETSQSIEVMTPDNYFVTATFNQCVQEDALTVGDDCPGRIFIPNVFSPNGDDLNDYFQVTYVNMEYLSVRIFDRWGKFVYESLNKDFQWDGTYNGRPLPEGVYYFQMLYKFSDNENELEAKGNITILR